MTSLAFKQKPLHSQSAPVVLETMSWLLTSNTVRIPMCVRITPSAVKVRSDPAQERLSTGNNVIRPRNSFHVTLRLVYVGVGPMPHNLSVVSLVELVILCVWNMFNM